MKFPLCITPIDGLPPIKDEPLVSLSDSTGTLLWVVQTVTGKSLAESTDPQLSIDLLRQSIANLDRGNASVLNNLLATELCSFPEHIDGIQEEWYGINHLFSHSLIAELDHETFDNYVGYRMRSNVREIAMRLFLYLSAGYQIRFGE
ncbi:hypothetical protein D3C87_504700 [compost metagenome]